MPSCSGEHKDENISCLTIPCFLRSGFSRWEAGKAQIGTASVGLFGALVALCLDSEVWLLLTLLLFMLLLMVVDLFVGNISVFLFFSFCQLICSIWRLSQIIRSVWRLSQIVYSVWRLSQIVSNFWR